MRVVAGPSALVVVALAFALLVDLSITRRCRYPVGWAEAGQPPRVPLVAVHPCLVCVTQLPPAVSARFGAACE
eukprot:5964395-Lingulodinium_polyedra.AAC.1